MGKFFKMQYVVDLPVTYKVYLDLHYIFVSDTYPNRMYHALRRSGGSRWEHDEERVIERNLFKHQLWRVVWKLQEIREHHTKKRTSNNWGYEWSQGRNGYTYEILLSSLYEIICKVLMFRRNELVSTIIVRNMSYRSAILILTVLSCFTILMISI